MTAYDKKIANSYGQFITIRSAISTLLTEQERSVAAHCLKDSTGLESVDAKLAALPVNLHTPRVFGSLLEYFQKQKDWQSWLYIANSQMYRFQQLCQSGDKLDGSVASLGNSILRGLESIGGENKLGEIFSSLQDRNIEGGLFTFTGTAPKEGEQKNQFYFNKFKNGIFKLNRFFASQRTDSPFVS